MFTGKSVGGGGGGGPVFEGNRITFTSFVVKILKYNFNISQLELK